MNDNLKYGVLSRVGVAPQTISSATTTTGTAMSVAGYDEALVTLHVGNYSNGTAALKIEDSATVGGTYADVAADQLQGTIAADATLAAAGIRTIGVRLRRLGLRIGIVTTGGSVGMIAGSAVHLYKGRHKPAA